ncbi:hypothetical protein [Herbaspirillum huttiense]|nr:hypothetical protein [Herbaspirillum huttiense]
MDGIERGKIQKRKPRNSGAFFLVKGRALVNLVDDRAERYKCARVGIGCTQRHQYGVGQHASQPSSLAPVCGVRPRHGAVSALGPAKLELKLRLRVAMIFHPRWNSTWRCAGGTIAPPYSTGSASYARQRREQLQAIHGSGDLVRQYGLLTARKEYALRGSSLDQHHVPGLTVEHQESAEYQRDAPYERTRTQCLDIYRILGRSHPSKCVLFANSQTNAARILAQLKICNSASCLVPGRKEPGRILPLKPGLVAIELYSEAPSWPQRHGEQDKQNDWSTDKLVRQTIAWVKNGKMSKSDPGVLVLVATLEQRASDGKSDLADVTKKLQPLIDSGQLKIVLCKSYQKYTSLGSGKSMAGAVTVIGRDDAKTRLANSKLREAELGLGWINNDESQLLVRMLSHAQDDELKLIDEATQNAAFVEAFCLRKAHQIDAGMILREKDLPFTIINTESARRTMQLLARQVELRTSFGFLGTAMLDVGR